jgi:hypothetical protein
MLRWSPAPQVLRPAMLAQAAPPPSGMAAWLASPGVAITTDLAAVGIGGLLSYSFLRGGSNWSKAWLIMTTVAFVKLWHDVSRT